jgi:hypothetical protein
MENLGGQMALWEMVGQTHGYSCNVDFHQVPAQFLPFYEQGVYQGIERAKECENLRKAFVPNSVLFFEEQIVSLSDDSTYRIISETRTHFYLMIPDMVSLKARWVEKKHCIVFVKM